MKGRVFRRGQVILFKHKWSKLNGTSEMCGAYFCLWNSLRQWAENLIHAPWPSPWAWSEKIWEALMMASYCRVWARATWAGECSPDNQTPEYKGLGWPSKVNSHFTQVQRHLTPFSLLAAADGQMWYFDLRIDVGVKHMPTLTFPKRNYTKSSESHQQLEYTGHWAYTVIQWQRPSVTSEQFLPLPWHGSGGHNSHGVYILLDTQLMT